MISSGFLRSSLGMVAMTGAVVIVVPLVRKHLIRPTSAEWAVDVCRGEHEKDCRPHQFFIGCGSVTEWAQKRCPEFSIVDTSYAAGGRCGYVVANVTCRVNLR
jgi:hypothetical protein